MPDHGILAWLAAGFVAGTIAKFLTGGWDAAGCLGLIAVGILGAMTAGWAWTVFAGYAGTGTDSLAAFGGAMIALWTVGLLAPRR
jgi:uncharacterized membrane protein YeaQ/YmgE (transglycosylase-associated protein family)